MSLIVILSGAISFHFIIATTVPVPASSSARELRPVEEVLEIEWASGPGLRIPSILLQNIGPWKFCEVYSTDMVCFQLWWQYNGSNIFFLGIRNSYWSLRGCHVHLSTCHSRDTGAVNLWGTASCFSQAT